MTVGKHDELTAVPRSGRPSSAMLAACAVLAVAVAYASPAHAQDPFASAKAAACQIEQRFETFVGVVGLLGMIACLMLGYFDKLNWRWVATGLGVAFFSSIIPKYVMSLGGGGC